MRSQHDYYSSKHGSNSLHLKNLAPAEANHSKECQAIRADVRRKNEIILSISTCLAAPLFGAIWWAADTDLVSKWDY